MRGQRGHTWRGAKKCDATTASASLALVHMASSLKLVLLQVGCLSPAARPWQLMTLASVLSLPKTARLL